MTTTPDPRIAQLEQELTTLRESYDKLRRTKTDLLHRYEALVEQPNQKENTLTATSATVVSKVTNDSATCPPASR